MNKLKYKLKKFLFKIEENYLKIKMIFYRTYRRIFLCNVWEQKC